MISDNVFHAWYEFAAKEKWTFFGTATFKYCVTKRAAAKKFSQLIMQAKEFLDTEFRCLNVIEGGDGSKRPHIHFLIAGIPYSPAVRRRLQRAWNALGGISHIVRFDEAQREAGISYILKTVPTGNSDQVDIHGDNRGQLLADSKNTRAIGQETAERPPADSKRLNDSGTVTIPAITITGGGFYTERHGAHVVVVLPLTKPRPSSTGKTNIIGSTGGPRATEAEFDGKPILVNAMAMVSLRRPAWRLRAYALVDKGEGKQASRATECPPSDHYRTKNSKRNHN